MKLDEITSNLPTSTEEINTVSLDVFEAATENWQNVTNSNQIVDGVILANHYEIPVMDILNLAREIAAIGPDNLNSIRASVGTVEYSTNPDLSEMRLYFTAINKANVSIFQNPKGESAIYDFTMPCPPTC